MKITSRIFMIIALALLISLAEAQENQKQAGFRFGNTTGFTGRIITENNFAFEGILGFRNGGAQLYGLFEVRKPLYLNRVENMFFYFGGGAHVGFVRWNEYDYNYDPFDSDEDYMDDNKYWHTGPAFGLDGIIGMEYFFNSAPISLAIDFKPFFELYGPFYLRANFWDFGFHVRYNF
ncbi:MAG: hypothetical protein M0Q51_04965 [Bacteroidales bacterium]|nr:hypothetical protein [Bacteroidales bacterium]